VLFVAKTHDYPAGSVKDLLSEFNNDYIERVAALAAGLLCDSQGVWEDNMGLDSVELVIRIEDTFGIQIPDRDAWELTTPRKVTDYILTRVKETDDPLPCLSQKAFYLLRRQFTQQLLLPRRQFTLDATLIEILPEERRDEVWKTIGSSLRIKKWPALSRRAWFGFMTPPVLNVRELIDHLVTNEPLIVKGNETSWTRTQVRDVLKRLITDETSIKDFSEDSRFVEDMHLD
jgi:acyl carrier protein